MPEAYITLPPGEYRSVAKATVLLLDDQDGAVAAWDLEPLTRFDVPEQPAGRRCVIRRTRRATVEAIGPVVTITTLEQLGRYVAGVFVADKPPEVGIIGSK